MWTIPDGGCRDLGLESVGFGLRSVEMKHVVLVRYTTFQV